MWIAILVLKPTSMLGSRTERISLTLALLTKESGVVLRLLAGLFQDCFPVFCVQRVDR
jgi:hypothetical protein